MSRNNITREQWLDTIREAGFVPLPNEPISPGDSYCAERNTGLKLLTCDRLGDGCIFPVELAYAFDTGECVKVRLP
jgi:hypothetical protein